MFTGCMDYNHLYNTSVYDQIPTSAVFLCLVLITLVNIILLIISVFADINI